MIGTYASALTLISVAVPIGAAIMRISGARRFSWVSAAVGLAATTTLAWPLVQLPGEGVAVAIALVAAALASTIYLSTTGEPEDLVLIREGLPAAALTLAVVSIPFLVEGHFGILGTGFNVDMSQHLFAAEWISEPLGPAPSLIGQGYPVGPHALAVAAAEPLGGDLVPAFTGTTIAVPVLGALTAFAVVRRLGGWRAPLAAVVAAVPYLVASYLAQGSFKELYLAVFILGFAIWLDQLGTGEAGSGPLAALPASVLGAAALYAYSGPGIAWLVGTAGIWGAIELARLPRGRVTELRGAVAPVAVAVVALALLVAPEIDRLADFGGSASTVANATDREPAPDRGPQSPTPETESPSAGGGSGGEGESRPKAGGGDSSSATVTVGSEPGDGLDLFNNDLGNLFGQINPLESLGIWPTGDFRVEPGDGAIPAIVFYAAALVGLVALALGVRGGIARGQTALVAALGVTVAIWLAARAISTPYATAKALQMVAPVAALLAVRELLDPSFLKPKASTSGRDLWRPGLALAFVGGALLSSGLALANAPVGPERYSAGIGKLRDRLFGEPVLMLAPPGQIDERHGAAYYGWELRGGRPICVEPFPEAGAFDQVAPVGIRFVITTGAKEAPPFEELELISRRRRISLWEARGYSPADSPVGIDADVPTDCEVDLDPPG